MHSSDSLIDDYAAGDLDDLRRDADFLEKWWEYRLARRARGVDARAGRRSRGGTSSSPVEAKQAASAFGTSPSAGIPLVTNVNKAPPGAAPAGDAELAALYREYGRLDGQAHAAGAARTGAPIAATGKQIDEQLVASAGPRRKSPLAKRGGRGTAHDPASKPNSPKTNSEMRAARMSADAAARQLHEAKVSCAGLQQLKANGVLPLDPSQVPP